jgi:hypothetical protein
VKESGGSDKDHADDNNDDDDDGSENDDIRSSKEDKGLILRNSISAEKFLDKSLSWYYTSKQKKVV